MQARCKPVQASASHGRAKLQKHNLKGDQFRQTEGERGRNTVVQNCSSGEREREAQRQSNSGGERQLCTPTQTPMLSIRPSIPLPLSTLYRFLSLHCYSWSPLLLRRPFNLCGCPDNPLPPPVLSFLNRLVSLSTPNGHLPIPYTSPYIYPRP